MKHSGELLVQTPEGAVRVIRLERERYCLGRAAENHLAFPDQQELSRRHLAFESTDAGWLVRDLGSRNGTLVNGVPAKDAVRLRSGDRIQAGKLVIEFRTAPPAASAASPAAPAADHREAATIAVRLDHLLPRTDAERGAPAAMPLTSARHLQALLNAGVELAGRMPLDGLLPLILDLAATAVGAPRGVLLLEENGQLAVRAVRGKPFEISSTARRRVLEGRESLLIQDVQREDSLRFQASIISQGVRSLLAVPLQTKERVLGLLYLDSAGPARAFSREDLNLITVMANMAAVAIENARLAEIEERERRVSLEMEQAAAIQRALLPAAAPSWPGLDIAAFSQPCFRAGGDYHDFFERPDGRVVLVVGDIAGKGMPAALLMASLQARVQVLIEAEPDPARLVERLNRITAADCPGNRFVTLFYCDIEPASGEMRHVNAGHNPPLLLRAGGGMERLDAGGLLLGVFPRAAYCSGRTRLEAGDTLVLYSDGVTEAARPGSEEEFGEGRLAEAVAGGRCAREMVESVRSAVSAFAGSVSAADDFTLVVARKLDAGII